MDPVDRIGLIRILSTVPITNNGSYMLHIFILKSYTIYKISLHIHVMSVYQGHLYILYTVNPNPLKRNAFDHLRQLWRRGTPLPRQSL